MRLTHNFCAAMCKINNSAKHDVTVRPVKVLTRETDLHVLTAADWFAMVFRDVMAVHHIMQRTNLP